MPFTLSHVAAVLPMLRGQKVRWSATGLILGSITPDFEKFVRLGAHNELSHSWASLVYFSLPVAVVLAFLFHGLIRNPLIAHLPLPLRQRLARFQRFDWVRHFRQHYPNVVLSVLLGAATHLVWDSFTHLQSPLIKYWPFLMMPLHVGAIYAPVFVVANAISSAVGLWLVVAAVWRLPARRVPLVPASASYRYWGMVGLIAPLLLAGRLLLVSTPLLNIDVIISIISGTMMGILVASGYHTISRYSRLNNAA
jgi:hypothetical protein